MQSCGILRKNSYLKKYVVFAKGLLAGEKNGIRYGMK
jgi:hypothetical protein